MTTTPFVDGGRDRSGRFAPGNRGGPGNPLGGKIAKLRAALVEAVTDAIVAVWDAVVEAQDDIGHHAACMNI